MNLSRLLRIFVFLGAWGAIAFSLMPIKLMLEQWGAPVGVNIKDPSGTLWDGQAGFEFRVGKTPILVVADWSWCPSWNRGLLSACFEIENEALSGHGFLYSPLFGDEVGIENARLQVKFGRYTRRLLPLPVEVLGAGNISISSATLDRESRLPVEVNASGRLTRMQAGETELGDYLWRLSTNPEDKAIEAKASGGADVFQLKAQARLSPTDRSYQYEVELSSGDKKIQSLVAPFTKTKTKGVYIKAGEGVLAEFPPL